MHKLWGMRPARRMLTGFVSSAAIVCGAPAIALADHPGAVWSVSLVEAVIHPALEAEIDRDAVIASVRSGMRRANQTYFYGDLPVRMKVFVRGAGAPVADIVITDGLSGAVLAEARGLALDGDALADRALAWMDGLECAGGVCGAGGSSAIAAAPAAETAASGGAASDPVAKTAGSTRSAKAREQGSPAIAAVVPVPRPTALAQAKEADLIGSSIGRSVATLPEAAVAGVHLARLDTTGLRNITYGEADRLVLADPVPRPLERPISSSRRANPTSDMTIVEQMFESLAQLIGLGNETTQEASRVSAATQASDRPRGSDVDSRLTGKRLSVRAAVASADDPFRSNTRWERIPVPSTEPSFAPGERIAALSIRGNGAAPVYAGAADPEVAHPTEPRVRPVASGNFLGVPAQPGARGAIDATLTSTEVAPEQPEPRSDLSVRLHPEIFGRFAAEQYAGLFAPVIRRRQPEADRADRRVAALSADAGQTSAAARSQQSDSRVARPSQVASRRLPNVPAQPEQGTQTDAKAPTQRDVSPAKEAPRPAEEGDDALATALAKRGLAMDEGVYSKNLRVSWDGEDRGDAFVVTLPQLVGFKYAIVAMDDRTLVARVESVPGPVRLSRAVATTLGLRRDEWADVRVVALREIERVASSVSEGQVFASTRISLPLE
ncbi:MAG: hypothetical protein AAFV19_18200 [Pseudomonadota bacterium]